MVTGYRIAIAEDDPLIRLGLRSLLLSLGHEVVSEAETGAELVRHCRLCKPDLVVSDMTMPELDGVEAARAINTERKTPVILVSSRVDWSELGQGLDFVVGRLQKPVTSVQLQTAITSGCSRNGQAVSSG